MPKIDSIKGRKILNSRGDWTIEVSLALDDGTEASASVPEGVSKGSHEAVCVSPEQAIENIETIIEPALKGMDARDQKVIDRKLIELDGTENKSKLGANATLGVSHALARVNAESQKIPLWKYLRQTLGKSDIPKTFPRLLMNIINGGLHAGNNLDLQEYMVIPKSRSPKEAEELGTQIYHALEKHFTDKLEVHSMPVGDEGGFAPDFRDNLGPFEVFEKVLEELDCRDKVDFGLDAAISSADMKTEELFDLYKTMKEKFGLFYLEDPFAEDDFKNFKKIKEELPGAHIIGDDLTTTNVTRMQKAKEEGSINGVIIKPNQIGTLTETLQAVSFAKNEGWFTTISHRSGETDSDFIADLAFAVEADGIKLGAPARGERIVKYNRFLEIERSLL